jgi:hypothetical protein
MAKRPAPFKQSDLQRALRAAKCAGLEVKSVEVDPATGKITITTTAGIELPAPNNALDQWLASHARPT